MSSVIVMILKYLLGFFTLHPETWKGRVFFLSLLGGIGTSLVAIATSISANDQNILDYFKDCSPILLMLFPIYIRDAIAKGHARQADIAKQILDVITKLTSTAAVLLFFFMFTPQSQAKEIFNQPLVYFLKAKPVSGTQLDTAYWWFKPTVTVPVLQLRQSNSQNSKLDVSTMASAGGGITYQRTVVQDGKNYSTISFSLIELLAANSGDGAHPDFAAGFVVGMFNNLFQIGGAYDFGNVVGPRWLILTGFGINLTNN